MGDLLRKGARMLSEACPECGTPLFQLKSGGVVCPMCRRPVKYIDDESDEETFTQSSSLESTLKEKMESIREQIKVTDDPVKIMELSDTLKSLIETLEKVKSLK